MTKLKAGADAPVKEAQAETPATPSVSGPVPGPVEEQPMTGGAYVRRADGTLTREEQEG